MGRSDRHEIFSRLGVLIVHLMKLRYQPEKAKGGWYATIRIQRAMVRKRLIRNPAIRANLQPEIQALYSEAAAEAADETALPLSTFPDLCPFTLDEIMDDGFFG